MSIKKLTNKVQYHIKVMRLRRGRTRGLTERMVIEEAYL